MKKTIDKYLFIMILLFSTGSFICFNDYSVAADQIVKEARAEVEFIPQVESIQLEIFSGWLRV